MEIPVARRIKLIIPSKYPRFDHRTKHARYDIKENPIDCRDIEYKGTCCERKFKMPPD